MARRRGRNRTEVSLFPFLSILVCVVGVLTLLLAGLSLGEITEEAGTGFQIMDIRQSTAAARTEHARLASLVEQAEAMARKITAMRSLLGELEDTRDRSKAASREADDLREDIRRGENEAAALMGEFQDYQGRIRDLEEKIARQDEEAGTFVLTHPGGRTDLVPVFAECTAAGLTLNPDRESARSFIPVDKILDSEKVKVFLRALDKLDNYTAIFLLRPGGVQALDYATHIARSQDTRHGYMPVPGQKEIDFSLLSARRNRR